MTFVDDIVTSMPNTSEEHVSHYLRTGHCDINAYVCWPGNDVIDCMRRAKAALRSALVDAVRERVAHARSFRTLPEVDVTRLTIEKAAPMVQRLFPLEAGRRVSITRQIACRPVVARSATVCEGRETAPLLPVIARTL
jgi:hypothetical protein